MPQAINCPNCHATTLLPDGFATGSEVECPTCLCSFVPADPGVIGGLPPESPAAATGETTPSDTLASLMRQADPPPSEHSTTEFSPAASELSDLLNFRNELPAESPSTEIPAEPESTSSGETVADDDWDDAVEQVPVPGLEADDEGEDIAVEIESDDAAADDVEETEQSSEFVAPPAVATRPRKKRKSSLIKIAIFVLGHIIIVPPLAYVGLLWVLWAGDNLAADPVKLAHYLPEAVLPPGAVESEGEHPDSINERDDVAAGRPSEPPPGGRVEPANYEQPIPDDSVTTPPPPSVAAEESASPLPAAVSQPLVVHGAPSYDTAQLNKAIEIAKPAVDGLLKGEFRDPDYRYTKGRSYATLCKLAHVLTFYDTTGADYSMAAEIEANEQFKWLMREPRHREEIARITAAWLVSPNRQGGVFFSGRLNDGSIAGPVFEYSIKIATGDVLTILRQKRLNAKRFKNAAEVAVIGEVIDQPALRIPGYNGTHEQVIWAGYVFPIKASETSRDGTTASTPDNKPGGFQLNRQPELDL